MAQGLDALALSEVAVLSQLSNQLRTCISTCGYGGGAAARDACWRYLYGHVTVWIDSNPNASEASEPQVRVTATRHAQNQPESRGGVRCRPSRRECAMSHGQV